MKDTELEAATILRRARARISPSSDDAARIRHALEARLLSSDGHDVNSTEPSSLPPSALNSGAIAKLALAALVAVSTGAAGYVLGYRAGSAERSQSNHHVVLATAPIVPPVVASAPPTPQITENKAPSATAPPRHHASFNAPAAASVTANDAKDDAGATDGSSALETETRMLVRIERALREQNPRFALGLLGELDREVPGGQLKEERQAARVLAHCQMGSATAAELARDFTARHPGSAYVARINRTCDQERVDEKIP